MSVNFGRQGGGGGIRGCIGVGVPLLPERSPVHQRASLLCGYSKFTIL